MFAADITGSPVNLSSISTPAGKSDIAVKGSYTLDAGQTADKIEAKFYTSDKDGNETFFGSNTAPDPIQGGKYETGTVRLDSGTKYTVRLELSITTAKTPIAKNAFSFTAP